MNQKRDYKKRRHKHKRTKREKRLTRLSRFILRTGPAIVPQLTPDLSNDELLELLEPLFDQAVLVSVHPDYQGFCKEMIATKQTFVNLIKSEPPNFTRVLLSFIDKERPGELKREQKKLDREVDSLVHWLTTLLPDSRPILESMELAASLEDIVAAIEWVVDMNDLTDQLPSVVFIGTSRDREGTYEDLLQEIRLLPDESFPAIKRRFITRLKQEKKQYDKEEDMWEAIQLRIPDLEAKYAVEIYLDDLASYGSGIWGMKIFINEKGYLFDYEARNVEEIIKVIEEVVEDYFESTKNELEPSDTK